MSATAETTNGRLRGNIPAARCDDHVVKSLLATWLARVVAQRCVTLRNSQVAAAVGLTPRLSCASSPGRRGIVFAIPSRAGATGASHEKERAMYLQQEIATDTRARATHRKRSELRMRTRFSAGRAHWPACRLEVAENIRAFPTDMKSEFRRKILATVMSVGTAAIRFIRLAATVGTLVARTTS